MCNILLRNVYINKSDSTVHEQRHKINPFRLWVYIVVLSNMILFGLYMYLWISWLPAINDCNKVELSIFPAPFSGVHSMTPNRTEKQSVSSHHVEYETSTGYVPKFKKCSQIYFDFGSNIGVQTRKLFEPDMYPFRINDYPVEMVDFFNATFGDVSVRRESVCSFGFEANPSHKARLDKVQNCYSQKGWNAEFQIRVVGDSDDEVVSIWSDPNSIYNDWGAGLYAENNHTTKEYKVQMIDIARFVEETINYYHVDASNIFIKFDIEGSEYFVLEHMLQSGLLCKDVVASAVIEWHPKFKKHIEKSANVTFSNDEELKHRIRDVSKCEPFDIVPLDDESYLFDEVQFPCPEMN